MSKPVRAFSAKVIKGIDGKAVQVDNPPAWHFKEKASDDDTTDEGSGECKVVPTYGPMVSGAIAGNGTPGAIQYLLGIIWDETKSLRDKELNVVSLAKDKRIQWAIYNYASLAAGGSASYITEFPGDGVDPVTTINANCISGTGIHMTSTGQMKVTVGGLFVVAIHVYGDTAGNMKEGYVCDTSCGVVIASNYDNATNNNTGGALQSPLASFAYLEAGTLLRLYVSADVGSTLATLFWVQVEIRRLAS